MIDGAYGAPAEDALHYKTGKERSRINNGKALLIGAGIGITPFASILKSIWYAHKTLETTDIKRVYFMWVCREKVNTSFIN